LLDKAARPMNYGTVCSGIGAPECAWSDLGWKCQFAAEIDVFPSAVHAHRFPGVPNYGDITKFKEWPEQSIDILVGGTPCQSFSVAGLRKGLADPRGNLMLTFLAITGRYAPTWVVWENVPGVLSIDGGRAFGAFLGGLAELGYGFAYRVLDAQFFGVAQRRRRVFVVGCAGGQWQRAAAVLFERESLCGNPAPRRETRERLAPTISARTKGGGGLGTDADLDGALITHSLRADGFDASEDSTARGTPVVAAFGGDNCSGPIEIATACRAHGSFHGDFETETMLAFSSKDHGADAGHTAPTLRAAPHDKSHANSGAPPAIAFKPNQGAKSRTLGASEHVAPTLESAMGGNNKPAVQQGYAVRRLTPTECERLQGFPDGWTAIQYRGKPAADGPRYKALGNSMAVPVLKWIGQRIEMVHKL
jgi:DNA (cytosine-5)-methyltransferase 1